MARLAMGTAALPGTGRTRIRQRRLECSRRSANKGILYSNKRHRLKYEALGLATRARARTKLGELPAAIEDAASAVNLARRLADPSVLINALAVHLQIDGNDALLNEARGSVDGVVGALTDERLRQQFLKSENVLTVMKR